MPLNPEFKPSDYLNKFAIGSGVFGVVYHAEHKTRKNLPPIAAKVFHMDPKATFYYEREVDINVYMMQKADETELHENICYKYLMLMLGYESTYLGNAIYFQLLGPTLEYRVYSQNYVFSYDDVREAIRSITRGLKFLVRFGIIHRDLKLDNVCFATSDVLDLTKIKIADFGHAWRAIEITPTRIGTPLPYSAPEIVLRHQYSYEVDIWCLGCLVYELFNHTRLFPAQSYLELLWRIKFTLGKIPEHYIRDSPVRDEYYLRVYGKYKLKHDYPKVSKGEKIFPINKIQRKQLSDRYAGIRVDTDCTQTKKKKKFVAKAYKKLMKKMLDVDPYYRITAPDILHSEFVQDKPKKEIKKEMLERKRMKKRRR